MPSKTRKSELDIRFFLTWAVLSGLATPSRLRIFRLLQGTQQSSATFKITLFRSVGCTEPVARRLLECIGPKQSYSCPPLRECKKNLSPRNRWHPTPPSCSIAQQLPYSGACTLVSVPERRKNMQKLLFLCACAPLVLNVVRVHAQGEYPSGGYPLSIKPGKSQV